MMNQRNIGILVTNTDHSKFAQAWPSDGEKFTTLLQSARPQWTTTVYDCTKGEFPSDVNACDGYVIGGSPASVNDDEPWIHQLLHFIRDLDHAKTSAVGCCFGHQAIAKALGGEVGRNPGGWGFGIAETKINTAENWMQPAAESLKLCAAHSEQVIVKPKGARTLSSSEFCPAGTLVVGHHFMSTQYHPEMTDAFFEALTHALEKVVGTELALQARAEVVQQKNDGLLFAEWIAKFFELS